MCKIMPKWMTEATSELMWFHSASSDSSKTVNNSGCTGKIQRYNHRSIISSNLKYDTMWWMYLYPFRGFCWDCPRNTNKGLLYSETFQVMYGMWLSLVQSVFYIKKNVPRGPSAIKRAGCITKYYFPYTTLGNTIA